MSVFRYLIRSQRHWIFIILLFAAAAGVYLVADTPGARLYASAGKLTVKKDVTYAAGSTDSKHRLDLYLPKTPRRFPVVIFVHGGFWHAGDRRYYEPLTGLYGNIGAALAERGVGVVIPSYRLSPAVDIRGQVDDIRRVVAWTIANIANEGGDASSIYLMGHSAGGHLVALLGTDTDLLIEAGIDPGVVKGVIALSGIYDLSDMEARSDGPFNESVTYPHFGRTPEALASWSPITHAGPGAPPFFIAYGESDLSFVKKESEQFAEKLRLAGRPPIVVVLPGFTHNQMVLRFNGNEDVLSDMIAQFVGTRR